MPLIVPEPVNKNYCAVVVALGNPYPLDGCDNVRGVAIFGNQIIVGKDASAGQIGLFFPVETALNKDFLKANNLYRENTWNADTTKKGYFEEHGRVKAVKFRGHKSEGLWLPIDCLHYTNVSYLSLEAGQEFDAIGTLTTKFHICHKYTPKGNPASTRSARSTVPRQAKLGDRFERGQFRFHHDTNQLRRNIHHIKPDTIISVTDKWHGTSAVFGHLLVTRELTWFEKLLDRFGWANISNVEYAKTWASRTVVKGVNEESKKNSNHFYKEDVWRVTYEKIKDKIPKGYTVYGEIVGYTPSGGAIQKFKDKVFSYGCKAGESRFVVYRVTHTNDDGVVLELGWQQVKLFCNDYGLEHVHEFYYGQAGDLHTDRYYADDDLTVWQSKWLKTIEQDYVDGRKCAFNENRVPAEGVVVRIDDLSTCHAYKAKSFDFMLGETKALDDGEVDIETEESLPEAA